MWRMIVVKAAGGLSGSGVVLNPATISPLVTL
jgi:hypothetical protein